jgi:hypothetical protein
VDAIDRLLAQGGSCPAAVPIRGATDYASGCLCGVMLNDSRRADSILEGSPIGVHIAALTDPSTLIKWCFGDGLPQVDPDANAYVASYTTCPVWLAEWEVRHLASARVGGVFEDDEQEAAFDLVDALMTGDAPGWEEDPLEDLSARDQANLLLQSGAAGR